MAEILESKHSDFSKGDHVSGMLQWKETQVVKADGLIKVDPDKAPLSAYLGILGMTGLTAYLGLTEIGKPKKGEALPRAIAVFALTTSHRFLLYRKVTYFRKGFDGLCGLVQNELNLEPTSGEVFIFINRTRDRMKLLHLKSGEFSFSVFLFWQMVVQTNSYDLSMS